MRLTYENTNVQLEWDEDRHVNELVVENPVFFRQIVDEMRFSTEESKVGIFDKKKEIKPKTDVDVIFSPVNLDFNSRKVTTTLLKVLVKASLSEDFYLSTNKFKTKIIKYLNDVISSEGFGFEVESDDFSIDQIAKAVNFHVVGDEDDFVELITDYLEVMTELGGVKLFIFIELRSYLNENEIKRFIKNLKDRQIDVLLVEKYDSGKVDEVLRTIIDNDLCEL